MNKKITMPVRAKLNAEIDKWVDTREPVVEAKPVSKPKRLTIDIDPALHKKLKMSCVKRDTQIADLLRTLIARELDSQK